MNSSKKIKKINQLKRKIVCLTAYSKPIAKILDKYCDIILVGDSLATAFYGMKSTKEINLDTMINHGVSVSKSVKKSVLVFDMPFNTCRNLKEPKLKIMGIEAVKSSTPAPCRVKIKEALKVIMNKDEASLIDFIENFRSHFNKLSPEDIAYPRSCNGVAAVIHSHGLRLAKPAHPTRSPGFEYASVTGLRRPGSL